MEKYLEKIIHLESDESDEFYTEERCHILELYNTLEDRTQSIARARVEPRVTTAWHRLNNTTETILVLSGNGTIELGEEEAKAIIKGNVVRIPANCPQRVLNTGDEDLIFLCYCSPAFGDQCYEDLE
jgi:mannose-6-phosphate isomerase-like protein (cupin superfamily)